MSGFAAALAKREGQYSRANAHRRKSEVTSPVDASGGAAAQPLSSAQLRQLVEPILALMKTFTVYDVMGSSTQVIVISDNATLSVAFIAAQESRVNTCTIWDSKAKKFTGVLTVSDYVRILLYCHHHPQETDKISTMTIKGWRAHAGLEAAPAHAPDCLLGAFAEQSLVEAIHQMLERRINRLPVFAEEPGTVRHPTLISVLTFPQVLSHLARTLFTDSEAIQATGLQSPVHSPLTQSVLASMGRRRSSSTDASGQQVAPPAAFVAAGSYSNIFDVPMRHLNFPSLAPTYKQAKIIMTEKVVDALTLFLGQSIHSLPVVDDQDIIIDVIARGDVIRLENAGGYDVQRTLAEALSFRVASKIPVFHLDDTLREVTLHFVQTGIEEMFCVADDGSDKVLGHVSLVDIVKFFFALYPDVADTPTGSA
jgi:CBS-domain-containing membrane protein